MAGALMARRGKGGFLIILISAPFLIPVLIFGLAAVDSGARFGIGAYEFRALAGLEFNRIGCRLACRRRRLVSQYRVDHDFLPRQSRPL